ncbi:alpha/beta hydrolase family protein [Amphibacillus indicireducens]|uniref:Peptidase S9 prolyl oligopeptidase catalytic domain-containing protein n=1 Tax=Amphibacillus indicireducens TaxID=1076330 RepID=A0ABP7VTE2_9BACI
MIYKSGVSKFTTNRNNTFILYVLEDISSDILTLVLENIENKSIIIELKTRDEILGVGFYADNDFYVIKKDKIEFFDTASGKFKADFEIKKNEIVYKVIYINENIVLILNEKQIDTLFVYMFTLNSRILICAYNYNARKWNVEKNLHRDISEAISNFNIIQSYYPKKLLDKRFGNELITENINGRTIIHIKKRESTYSIDLKKFIVHEASFFSEKILFLLISNYDNPSTLIKFNIELKVDQLEDYMFSYHKIEHVFLKKYNLPFLRYSSTDNANNKVIVMLHGGPYYHSDFSYDYLTKKFIDLNYDIYKPNFYGSTGYTINYQKILKKNAGTIDLEQVLSFIKMIYEKYPKKKIYILGDSYGAYLCCLIAFRNDFRVKKIICTSPFTDIRFQMLFSNSKNLINELFTIKKIKSINPIDIAVKNELKQPLTIIHGLEDENCPYLQIENFKKVINKKNGQILKVKFLNWYGHYPKNKKEILMISKLILEELF